MRSAVGREKVVGESSTAHMHSTSLFVRQLDVLNIYVGAREVKVTLDGDGFRCKEPFMMWLGSLSVVDLSSLRYWASEVSVDC